MKIYNNYHHHLMIEIVYIHNFNNKERLLNDNMYCMNINIHVTVVLYIVYS